MSLVMLFLLLAAVVGVVLALRKNRGANPRPPGTAGLDEEAARPEVDHSAVVAARARVSQAVPDEVLSDALLDATPGQLAHLFAAVPDDVMAAALGTANAAPQEQARPEDLARLRGAGQAVDDLEIWSFGEKS